MTAPAKPGWRRWLRRAAWALLAAFAVAVILIESGLAERWMRSAVIAQIERMTGGTVELAAFQLHPWTLRAEFGNLTVHGREPAGTPPFFHAEHVLLDIRVISFFGRRVALDELRLDQPGLHVRFDKDGRSNVPEPQAPHAGQKPLREQLFDLAVRRLRWNDGALYWNDVRVPLAAEGGEFRCALDIDAPAPGQESFRGELSWQKVKIAARRYLPFESDVAAKFTLGHDRFGLEQFTWKLPASELNVSAELASFAQNDWTFRYSIQLGFADIRVVTRKPHVPEGKAEIGGSGEYRAGKFAARGSLAARDVALGYDWFHTRGIEARGNYELANNRLVVSDFEARALQGNLKARAEMELPELRFRVETRAQGMRLAAILAALDHPGFPVLPLHWDAQVSAYAVTTWTGEFQHLDSRGEADWTAPAEPAAGVIPASAHIPFHFARDMQGADLGRGWITTPTSRIEMSGRLGLVHTGIDAAIFSSDLLPWNDFINGLRGGLRGRDAMPPRVAGRAEWRGRITGPLVLVSFDGHAHTWDAAYGQFAWDEVEGDVSYSHDHLRLMNTRARSGSSAAAVNLSLSLAGWQFRDDSEWSLDVRLTREDTNGLQHLFGTSYPARGLLTGAFRGHGTRSDPALSATFTLENLVARGMHFDLLSGELEWKGDVARLSNAEVHKGRALARGGLTYHNQNRQIEFDLSAAELAIEDLEPLRNDRLPLAGRLQFVVRGSGPLRAPSAEGKLRLTQLKVGDEILGDFDLQLHSDGRQLKMETSSTMAGGRLDGRLQLILSGDYPMDGEISVENMDLDPFLQTALRLKELTGHSHVVGRFKFSGPLADPGRIAVDADISDINFDYEFVKLRNVGPLRLTYRRDEVRITSAHLAGPDTDLTVSGFARFASDRQISMALQGRANLRLLAGIWPLLDARGAAQVSAAVEGALPRPRITGKLHLENAAANYGDFPSGLSNVTGDCVFDVSRLIFENVTGEVGGGTLTLGGSVSYGEGPLRFDLNAHAQRVRIRYPPGMSWLTSGQLRLQGTTYGAVLSGRVVVERLLMLEGLDLAALMAASRGAVPGTGPASSYLRNLQLDIEAVSSSDARVEWASARFESEAELRIRGTAEHPVLLGHVHLLSGGMVFRGDRYRLTRGDINFANPFRLDPVLDLEATTTIQQYEISIQLSGPASKLTLSYRSDPPLPASDIITLLALGHTGEESQLRSTGGSGSTDLGAQALLSEAISSQVGGRVERLFGVSRFRVDPAFSGVGTDQNATARITIEQRLTRDLTVTYVTNVTSTQRQVIQIEYNVSRDLSILALRDENGTYGLDIKRIKRFK